MTKQIDNKDDLIRFLLYEASYMMGIDSYDGDRPPICVGQYGDAEVQGKLDDGFEDEVREILRGDDS